jgi:RNA polymerase sigma factor (sigma-70 family)
VAAKGQFLNNSLDERQKRDGVDFLAIYRRLRAIARTNGHVDSEAEDRLQEACVRLLESERTGVVREKEHYFKRILRNLKIDGLRHQSRRTSVALDDEIPDSHPGPERIAQARLDLEIAAKTLEALPSRCREAFELHRFADLSYAQIAQRMGISVSMVEKHIAEAILRFAAALDRSS